MCVNTMFPETEVSGVFFVCPGDFFFSISISTGVWATNYLKKSRNIVILFLYVKGNFLGFKALVDIFSFITFEYTTPTIYGLHCF